MPIEFLICGTVNSHILWVCQRSELSYSVECLNVASGGVCLWSSYLTCPLSVSILTSLPNVGKREECGLIHLAALCRVRPNIAETLLSLLPNDLGHLEKLYPR